MLCVNSGTDWNRYVQACEQEYERENDSIHCAFCGRPIGMQPRYIIDNDECCKACAKSAVKLFLPEVYLSDPDVKNCSDPEEQEEIIEQVIDDYLLDNRV